MDVFRWFGGDFRGVLAMEWWAEVLEVWSRLGGELEVICWVLGVWFQMEKKRKKRAELAEGEGEGFGALCCSGCSLSLGRQKAVKEEWNGGFIRG